MEDLYTLKNFPVYSGCVDSPQSEDITADMEWQISRDSGVIQLKTLLPLNVVYQAQHTTSAIGKLWGEHHKAFAEFIRRYNPASVFEIGGAHGILSTYFKDIDWAIVDHNPAPVEGCHAHFKTGAFEDDLDLPYYFDAVVHSHVFEHIYEPREFVKNLQKAMVAGRKMLFSVPHLASWLERKFTNCLNFEHTVYLIEPYIEYLLSHHGFRVVTKEYWGDGHSIFYAAVRDSAVKPVELPSGLYEANKQLYLGAQYHQMTSVKKLNTFTE